ncbi:RDD family protein [Rudaeicoccus suwonensis]|nr:RDD family protein [Rudaeicoccus suwonensis]
MANVAVSGPARPLRGLADQAQLVTGEGVLIDVPAASLPLRMLSALIDWLIYGAVLVALIVAVVFASRGASAAGVGTLLLVAMVAAFIVLPVTIETLSRGRSVGKLVCRLRVVRDDGGPIVFRHALLRGLLGFVELWLMQGVPAFVAACCNSRCRRLGDLTAGTYVVRLERGLQLEPPPGMPPHLRTWVAHSDMAALPDGLALAIRQFLTRRAGLSPAARDALASSLAAQVRPLVAPAPPPYTHVEDLLAAVMVRRGDLEAARLSREETTRRRLLGEPSSPDPTAGVVGGVSAGRIRA